MTENNFTIYNHASGEWCYASNEVFERDHPLLGPYVPIHNLSLRNARKICREMNSLEMGCSEL